MEFLVSVEPISFGVWCHLTCTREGIAGIEPLVSSGAPARSASLKIAIDGCYEPEELSPCFQAWRLRPDTARPSVKPPTGGKVELNDCRYEPSLNLNSAPSFETQHTQRGDVQECITAVACIGLGM
jgi:hypothetical protein